MKAKLSIKKALSLIVALVMLLTMIPVGMISVSADEPTIDLSDYEFTSEYVIMNVEDWILIAREAQDKDFSGKTVKLGADLDSRVKYGLDKPLFEQYTTYLKDIVTRFDFGPSLKQRGREVIDIIADGMRTSAKLGLIAAGSALVVGVVLGSVAALRRNKLVDRIIMVITTAFVSMPSFIMGSILLLVFAVKLQVLPANGETAAGLILPIV